MGSEIEEELLEFIHRTAMEHGADKRMMNNNIVEFDVKGKHLAITKQNDMMCITVDGKTYEEYEEMEEFKEDLQKHFNYSLQEFKQDLKKEKARMQKYALNLILRILNHEKILKTQVNLDPSTNAKLLKIKEWMIYIALAIKGKDERWTCLLEPLTKAFDQLNDLV